MSKFVANPRTVKLGTVGSSVTGIVDEVREEVQMNFTAEGRPDGMRFDGNGNVVKTTAIYLVLQDDNGEPTSRVVLRTGDTIFTDSSGNEAQRLTSGIAAAIAEGLKVAGLDNLEVGHILTLTYTGDGEASSDDRNAPKLYTAVIAA